MVQVMQLSMRCMANVPAGDANPRRTRPNESGMHHMASHVHTTSHIVSHYFCRARLHM